jgi:simple sugar transport system permease protein
VAVGALMGLLLAYLSLRYSANQIIVGVVLVALAAGLTNYFNFQLLDVYSTELNVGNVAPNVAIPLLSKIPLLGPAFFDQNVYAYIADALVVVLSFGLFRTQWGLRVRAVGEHPRAAETAGINVIRTRYKCVVLGGAIAGLGGAYYTLGQNGQFAQGMTAGLGYIALATMIFGRWRPYLCFGAAILFGVMTSISSYVQTYNTGLNSEYLIILPYVVTILVVAGLVGHVRPPAADGVPYSRE